MPDCDKFEREIRKSYRKSYRLACGNARMPDEDLLDELAKAFEQDIKTDLECPVTQLRDAIFDAVTEQPKLQFGSTSQDSLDSRHHFTKKLEEIQDSCGNSVGAKLGTKASKQVCDELRLSKKPVTIEQVELRLSEKLGSHVVEDSFLSRIRDGLMKTTGRTQLEEEQWESELKEGMKQRSRDLLKPAFKARDTKAAHAPRRRNAKKWDKARLLDPVQVVKG